MLRETYEEKWRDPEYREKSPFETAWKDIENYLLEMRDSSVGRSVLDVGCGKGTSLKLLSEAGFTAAGYDISKNCLDDPCLGQLYIGCITDMPSVVSRTFDAVTCIDVMEHIPEEMVPDALKAMADCCTSMVVIQISTFRDYKGLHVTVKPADWWKDHISEHFPHVAQKPILDIVRRNSAIMFVAKKGEK